MTNEILKDLNEYGIFITKFNTMFTFNKKLGFINIAFAANSETPLFRRAKFVTNKSSPTI